MTLKTDWVDHCLRLAKTPADFYAGGRKILVNQNLVFEDLDNSLQMQDAGYTKAKLSHLTRNYLHEESKGVALQLWEKRLGQGTYGSVGFTCYAHFVKGGSIDAKRSKRASVFGPCIQSVTLTLVAKDKVTVDVFYRTTEVLKKFPADLVFIRDVLLSGFSLDGMKIRLVCHFANITVHPMYFVTITPMMDSPLAEMLAIKKADAYYHDWLVKWTARYNCEEFERGILKFRQALRVRMDARKRLAEAGTFEKMQKYVRKHHPGYRSDYVPPEEEENDE